MQDQTILALLQQITAGRSNLSERQVARTVDPDERPALEAFDSFRLRVRDALLVLDKALGQMSVKDALNVLQLRRLTEIIEGQHGDIARLTDTVDEIAQGVTRVAQDAHQAAQVTERMSTIGMDTVEAVRVLLGTVAGFEGQAQSARGKVDDLVSRSRSAGDGLRQIRSLAGTTQLLALNAAIQAAHANDKAFAVVAQEMRSLAERTQQIVKAIEAQVAEMEKAASEAGTAMETIAGTAVTSGGQAKDAASGLEEIQTLLRDASISVQSIAAVAEEQAAATESAAASAQDLTQRVAAAANSLKLTRDMQVSHAAEEAQSALGLFTIGSRSDQVRSALEQMAFEVETCLEVAAAGGTLPLDDLWDTDYIEIKGADIALLQRLFRVDRVPLSGFQPPKYRTRYDHKVDEPLVAILDKYMDPTRVAFCTILDLNAFAVAQPRLLAHDWTGIPEQDLSGNRAKRIFGDTTGLRAARVALPDELHHRQRLGRQDLLRSGLFDVPTASVRPFLLQTYARDAGDVVLDMAMPVYVRNRRWGTVRMGFFPED